MIKGNLNYHSPPSSLLVHFSSGSNTINGHEKNFLGFDHTKQALQEIKKIIKGKFTKSSSLNIEAMGHLILPQYNGIYL